MTDARPQQNIRFRTACDPCSTAKVRCDKKHPACDRCALVGLPCSYSASRKRGRQSWRGKGVSKPILKTSAPTAILPRDAILAELPTQSPRDTSWESLLNYGQHEPTNISSSWLPNDILNADVEIGGDLTNFGVMNLAPNTNILPNQESTIHNPAPIGSGFMDELDSTSATKSTHDCEARAIYILSSMQHGEMHQGLMSCSTDPAHPYPDLDLTPSFDRVLSINKAALNGWSKLMKCSCAQCPHLILIYVSILSKMLFWYRIAAREKHPTLGGTGESDDSTSKSGGNTTTKSSSKEAPTIDKFGVHPTTIKIGMLNLDAEDEANLRRALLLRELNRMEQAIHEFMNVNRKSIEENAGESVRRTVQWSLAGIPPLIEELQDVIQIVKQKK